MSFASIPDGTEDCQSHSLLIIQGYLFSPDVFIFIFSLCRATRQSVHACGIAVSQSVSQPVNLASQSAMPVVSAHPWPHTRAPSLVTLTSRFVEADQRRPRLRANLEALGSAIAATAAP